MNRSTILDRSTTQSAQTFNALADPARIIIVEELRRGEVCVCELEAKLGLASNLLSYHLRILREAGLVSGRRRGRRTEYRIERGGLDSLRREVERLAEPQVADPR
jgi:ArsR family transcriptional regulator